MTHGARTAKEVYDSLSERLKGKIFDLSNFTENSFNNVWLNAVSEEFRRNEVQLTVAQFSGWVDYAGGPITTDDLEELDIEDDVTIEELNEFVNDIQLDELVRIVGVTRDEGTEASGNVTFTTQSAPTTIPEGTQVSTPPDNTGAFFDYETTDEVETASGVTTVDAPVEATDVGEEYNVGAGTVTFLPNPPGGVQGVTNTAAIDGGEGRETNDELRARAKNAVFRSSGGGTVQGMIGFIEEETGAAEVEIIEFPEGDTVRPYPHGHVVVAGGTEEEVLQAIRDARPASVEHVLIRPAIINFNVDTVVEGGDIDTARTEEKITEYLNGLGLADNFVEDKLIFNIMGSDEDIDNIVSFEYTVSDNAFFFDNTKDVYEMQLGEEMVDDGVTEVNGQLLGTQHTFVEDTDYQEVDNDGDTSDDAIDWSIGKTSVTTTITYSAGTTEYLLDADMIHGGITSVQNTTTATTLTEGTDFDEADTDGDNLHDGIEFLNTQNDGDSIDVTYEIGDLPDVYVDQQYTETFTIEQQKYKISDAMVEDGINEVTGTLNGNPHTFTEGVDFEEWDSNGDGRSDGIDWTIGGEHPDDDTSFTVLYDEGTQFLVDYDVDETDIDLGQDERIDAGDINVTIL